MVLTPDVRFGFQTQLDVAVSSVCVSGFQHGRDVLCVILDSLVVAYSPDLEC